jgi:hypothetical protein
VIGTEEAPAPDPYTPAMLGRTESGLKRWDSNCLCSSIIVSTSMALLIGKTTIIAEATKYQAHDPTETTPERVNRVVELKKFHTGPERGPVKVVRVRERLAITPSCTGALVDLLVLFCVTLTICV